MVYLVLRELCAGPDYVGAGRSLEKVILSQFQVDLQTYMGLFQSLDNRKLTFKPNNYFNKSFGKFLLSEYINFVEATHF